MIAHHPLTGKEIRILRTETQISTNQKTLVWIRASMKPSPRWERWYTLITESSAAVVSGNQLTAVIIPKDATLDEWLTILPTIFTSSSQCLLFAYNSTLDALEKRGFTWANTFMLDDLYDSYPYLSEPITEKDSLEKIVLSVAHILRMNRVAWTGVADRDALDYNARLQYDVWNKHCDGVLMTLPVDCDDTVIPRTTLILQYFRHPTNRRHREIRTALESNLLCSHIDNVLLLNETEITDLPVSDKLQTVVIGQRLTYYDVYAAALEHVKPGGFVICANADIQFNSTLSYLWKIPMLENRLFLSILRWEETTNGSLRIFGPRSDSQDSWIFARDALDFKPSREELGFRFGQSGCDNAIALIMMRKRFLVVNPAYSIQTLHLHTSNVRNYDPKHVIYQTHYLYIDPTAIQPFSVDTKMSSCSKLPTAVQHTWVMSILQMTFPRPLLTLNDDGAKTLCAMLRNNGHVVYANEKNLWTPPPYKTPLYHLTNGTFVTCDGLLSNFKTIFVGPHTEWTTGWQNASQTSLLTGSIYVPSMISAPLRTESRTSLSHWVLHYLPRALAVRRMVQAAGLGKPEFLVPQFADLGSFLSDCVWSDSEAGNITLLPIVDGMNYFSDDVWAVPPGEDDNAARVSSEDITLLRSLIPPLAESDGESEDIPVAVFCVDDDEKAVCTRGWAEETADKLFSKGWTVRYVSVSDSPAVRRKSFASASWIFGSSSNNLLDWMWQNQKGATVLEFMPIDAPIMDRLHLAGAAKLRYIAGIIQKEPIVFQRQNALLDTGRAVKQYGFKELLASTRVGIFEKPRIVIPAEMLTDAVAQNGGMFREMVALWKERNYIHCDTSTDTPFCWWGGIGTVLLYDYPTSRWWSTIPSYQMALFGNPAPPGPDVHVLRQSAWCFWPRSPRAVENIVARLEPLRGYSSRSIRSVFMGKVENGIQLQNRTAVNWSSSCDFFSMPMDATGQAYPFTQKEYLEKLCHSRFGLCLPGFGQKCNREIEYFACGTVPIITPGVDMKHYLVAPREGVHYFVANTPADVQRIVELTSPATWSSMSAAGRDWWRAYASVEGLFRLTWARIEQCRPYFDTGIPRHFP